MAKRDLIPDNVGGKKYKEDMKNQKYNSQIINVDFSKFPINKNDTNLYLDLFFRNAPDPESGRYWGVSLANKETSAKHINLCKFELDNDKYSVSYLNHFVPWLTIDIERNKDKSVKMVKIKKTIKFF